MLREKADLTMFAVGLGALVLVVKTIFVPLITVAGSTVAKRTPRASVVATRIDEFTVRNEPFSARRETLLRASRMVLSAASTCPMLARYWVGTAVRKAGGVAAVRAEVTMELMLPVMPAAAAADWMATPRPGRMLGGMYCEMICCASELNCAVLLLVLRKGNC